MAHLHFIWESLDSRPFSALSILLGQTVIGEIKDVTGGFRFEGHIHGQAFRIMPERPNQLPPLVSLTILKSLDVIGRLSWSIGDDGTVSLIKRKGGTNTFHIRPKAAQIFNICEVDGQILVSINTGEVNQSIWEAEAVSGQRPDEQCHEILLYVAILIRMASPSQN